jgi:hypothetical protein
MKDNDLRGLILRKYYEKRREGWVQWKSEDFTDVDGDFDADDLFRVCNQLGEHGLIEWSGVDDHRGQTVDGRGRISALGVDVIEGNQKAPLAINFDYSQHHVNVSSSSNVQVGSGNIQGVSVHIQGLAEAIDRSKATPGEKEAAKSALRQFLDHPAVSAILGGLASTVR